MPTERCLSDFAGSWQITREIIHADGSVATFLGQARFSPTGQGALRYVETGDLRLPDGQTVRATRTYLWESDLQVFFEDGRPFLQVPAAGGEAIHLCPPDTYRVTYDFTPWPQWQAIWSVTGPKKAYRMVSTYAPAT